MHSIDTELGDGFAVRISFESDSDGYPEDMTVYSSKGECLDLLITGTRVWDEAYAAAERHLNGLPVTKAYARQQQRDHMATCYDTPYQ